jgi:hypothetical protein
LSWFQHLVKGPLFGAKDSRSSVEVLCFHLEVISSDDLYLISGVLDLVSAGVNFDC